MISLKEEPVHFPNARPWVLIAAYDVSTGSSSEGYVALQLLRELQVEYRVILLTRENNAAQLRTDPSFRAGCAHIHLVGYDLPRWARWWKRGARFYQAYAWLWQMCWPLALRSRHRIRVKLLLVHVLNFHNDSFPSSAWCLGRPAVWGPINHNEAWAAWRLNRIPNAVRRKMQLAFSLRRMQWRCDPFLRLWVRRASAILVAGPWVERRLGLKTSRQTVRRSQLGVNPADFPLCPSTHRTADGAHRLVYAGRLDWIKGVDLAMEALALLPEAFQLEIIGHGPAEEALKSLTTELKLQGRVVFRDPVPRSELPSVYACADVFLFPSAEVAGLAWVEAQACGLPVAGFSAESELSMTAPELVGVHLAPDLGDRDVRVQAYADAIQRAAADDRNPSAIRARALERYAWVHLADVILAAYQTQREACP